MISTADNSLVTVTTVTSKFEVGDRRMAVSISPPDGSPRVRLGICLPDLTITAEIAAKSLRKAQTAIREADADNIALVLQGRLIAGDHVAEAGLSAQSKATKLPPRPCAPEIMIFREIDMAKHPFERPSHPQRVPLAPPPSSTSAPEGMENTRALARRYLPDVVRLLASIAFAPDSEAALHTRMLCAKEIVAIAGVIPQATPAPPPYQGADDSREPA